MSRTKVTEPIRHLEQLPAEEPGPASNRQPEERPLGQHIISKLAISEAWICSADRGQRQLWQKLQKADKWKSYREPNFIHSQLGPGLPPPPFHLDADADFVQGNPTTVVLDLGQVVMMGDSSCSCLGGVSYIRAWGRGRGVGAKGATGAKSQFSCTPSFSFY